MSASGRTARPRWASTRTGTPGPVTFWHVPDIAAAIAELVAAGAEEQQPARDVGGRALTATVRDADGNVTGLFQAP